MWLQMFSVLTSVCVFNIDLLYTSIIKSMVFNVTAYETIAGYNSVV